MRFEVSKIELLLYSAPSNIFLPYSAPAILTHNIIGKTEPTLASVSLPTGQLYLRPCGAAAANRPNSRQTAVKLLPLRLILASVLAQVFHVAVRHPFCCRGIPRCCREKPRLRAPVSPAFHKRRQRSGA